MLILSVANIDPLALSRALEAASIPATVLPSFGTCAPWPIESGATAVIAGDTSPAKVEAFAGALCRDRGETCAALISLPGATLSFVPASPKPED